MIKFKKYFNEKIQLESCKLDHLKPTDFYLSVCQNSRSALPLLILRALLFLCSLAIGLSSILLYETSGILKFWLIYVTHWGILLIVFTTGSSTLVSAKYCFCKPEAEPNPALICYMKTFWVSYNIANPIALLITIFYWTVLYEAEVKEEVKSGSVCATHGMDIAIHGLNTAIMLLMLFSSRLPIRLLHLWQPVLFSLCWVIFSIIYYLAGGTDSEGHRHVYIVVDWSYPGPTTLLVFQTGVMLMLLHLLTIGLVALRDAIATTWRKSMSRDVEAIVLRQNNDEIKLEK